MSAFAIESFAEDGATEYKYYDKFVEQYKYIPDTYEELYSYYSDENSEEPEWTLVYSFTEIFDMSDQRYGASIEDILIFGISYGDKSASRYLVYVTALDEFLRVDARDEALILENCPDFVETMKAEKYCVLRGDINDDFEVDILDATYIQRIVAEYQDKVNVRSKLFSEERSWKYVGSIFCVHTYEGERWNNTYISDYDYDGETTILDATAIQMKLAKVE